MPDEIESRIGRAYGHIEPPGEMKDRVLDALPGRQLGPRAWHAPAGFALVVVVVVAVTLSLIGGGTEDPGPDPARRFPVASFRTSGDAAAVAKVMNRRIQGLEISEGRAEVGDDPDELEVFLPVDVDVSEVTAALARPGTVEFRIVIDNPAEGEGRRVESARGGPAVTVEEPTDPALRFGVEDMDAEEVRVVTVDSGRILVAFEIRDARKADFETFTGNNINRSLAIILDGVVESAPRIMDRLPGRGMISGGDPRTGFTLAEAEALAAILRSGSYPADVWPEEPR